MQMIRPNCRAKFNAEDHNFIIAILAPDHAQRDALAKLLTDPEARDEVLDDDAIFNAILDKPECLTISNHLYFYVLVRRVLKQADIRDREVADYVASMLAAFSSTRRSRRPHADMAEPMDYLVDMQTALRSANDQTRFLIRAHMGNHSLYMTGVFPRHVKKRRERRAAPGMKYYEDVGRANFHAASKHALARTYNLGPVFEKLSDSFGATRKALNDLSERLICLDDDWRTVRLLIAPPEQD